MITRTIEIAEGARVNYIHTDKFKTNLISFNFITQMNRETVHFNAMIPVILMRGCKKYPTQADLNRRLQYLYSTDIDARNNNVGEFQVFGFSSNMLNNRFAEEINIAEEVSELLCQMIFEPYTEKGAFLKKYVESEKINLIDTIEAEINNKTRYSMNRCMEEMCKDEIFSVKKYGTVEDVESIDEKSLYNAYLKALRHCKIEIYVVGDCNLEAVAEIFKSYLDKIDREVVEPVRYPIVRKATEVKRVDECQDINQGKLCIGMRTGRNIEDGSHHIAQLFSEIYGASPTSKLFVNVREKMSLCYFCRSMIQQRNGVLMVASGIEFTNKEIAEDAILKQLDAIKNGEITVEELENAKRSLCNSYMSIYDGVYPMEIWTLNRSLSGNYDTPLDEKRKVEGATVEEIIEYAKGITLDTVYFLKGEDKNG
ncbi:MAG: insulinase family protein [Clostridia bacterium]|nr:insulinase family protein [Clostridia bacterium]